MTAECQVVIVVSSRSFFFSPRNRGMVEVRTKEKEGETDSAERKKEVG